MIERSRTITYTAHKARLRLKNYSPMIRQISVPKRLLLIYPGTLDGDICMVAQEGGPLSYSSEERIFFPHRHFGVCSSLLMVKFLPSPVDIFQRTFSHEFFHFRLYTAIRRVRTIKTH